MNKGVTANATIYATRVSNPSGKIETFTSSTQKMFTDKVNRVDVHALGAGAGGSSGCGSFTYNGTGSGDWSATYVAYGGHGGGEGKNTFKQAVSFTPNKLFQITVGDKGVGGASPGSSSSSQSKRSGTSGGSSSCLGVTASGGSINATIGADKGQSSLYPSENAQMAKSNSTHQFNDESLPLIGGGDGGGGAASLEGTKSASSGGSPNGGNGGGNPAKGPGGGGGGGNGSVSVYNGSATYSGTAGGDGGPGAVYVRWFYS